MSGPRLPFFLAAGIAGVNALVAVRRLPETHRRPESHPRPEVAPHAGHGAAAPAPATPPARRPRIWAGLRGRPLRLVVMAFLSLVAFSGFEGTFALLLADRFGLTLSSTGAVFVGIGLALVAVQAGLVHPVTTRLGERLTLTAGLLSNAAGLLLLAVGAGWGALVAALGLLVLGQGLVTPTVASALAGAVAPSERGRMLGFQQSAGSAARFLGPFLAGVLYQHLGIPWPYALGAVLVLLAVPLVPPPGLESGAASAYSGGVTSR